MKNIITHLLFLLVSVPILGMPMPTVEASSIPPSSNCEKSVIITVSIIALLVSSYYLYKKYINSPVKIDIPEKDEHEDLE